MSGNELLRIFCRYPTNSAAHVLLCNIYSSSKRWDDVASVKEMGMRKIPSQRWIEVKNRLNVFFAEYIQCWRSCGCKCMMKIVFNSKYRLQQNLIHWQKQRRGSFSLLSSFSRITVPVSHVKFFRRRYGCAIDKIMLPIEPGSCSKPQVSYFLDELSMLYGANTRLQSASIWEIKVTLVHYCVAINI